MIGAFVALISFIIFGLTGVALPIILLLVLLIAMLFTACYGWTVEKLAYKPLRGSFRLAPLISALGMSIVLQNYIQFSPMRFIVENLLQQGPMLRRHLFTTEQRIPTDPH